MKSPVEFLVVARSRTRNGFGLFAYVFVDRQGNSLRAYKSDQFELNSSIFVNCGNFNAAGFECVTQIGEKMPAETLKRAWDRKNTPPAPAKPLPPPPSFTELMAWEDNQLDEDGVVDLFQRLINSGLAWQLQGMYGRQAVALIEAGLCHK